MLATMQTLPDPRIGMLQRSGHVVYYACIDGEFPERNTVEEIVALLEGHESPAAREAAAAPSEPTVGTTKRSKRVLKDYVVNVSVQFPAWNDKPIDLEIVAYTAREAEKRARDHVWKEGIFDRRMNGAIYVKARRAD